MDSKDEDTKVSKLRARVDSSTKKLAETVEKLSESSMSLSNRSSRIPRELLREKLESASSAGADLIRGFATYCRQFEGVIDVKFSAQLMTMFILVDTRKFDTVSIGPISQTLGGKMSWSVCPANMSIGLTFPKDAVAV